MQNDLFDHVVVKKPQRNAFNLSNIHNYTCDFGQLIPCAVREVLPGDSFLLSNEAFIRMAPLKHPILGRINIDFRWFFVPNRLVWDKWEDFITGGINGNIAPTMPYRVLVNKNLFSDSTFGKNTLADYMHIKFPNKTINSINIPVLPFRAYTKIYNDWYRDELLDTEININTNVSGSDTTGTYFNLLYRRFHKDYFTSARPSALLGQPVEISVSPTNNRDALYLEGQAADGNSHKVVLHENTEPFTLDFDGSQTDVGGSRALYVYLRNQLSAGTVQQLRTAFKMQEWQEKSMRGGNRYIESMLVHFGVKSSDARLQRSQYIGGTSTPIVISDIAQTQRSESGETPLGELAGKGLAVVNGKPLRFYSEEHGYLFCLASIIPEVSYNQGIHRQYLRDDKFDYAWPEFAHIGEQGIVYDEIFSDNPGGRDETAPFGYQSRYAEYKSYPNINSGEFRDSLSSWVIGRTFASKPSLNSQFIGIENSLTNLNNIFATPNDPGHFLCEVYNDIKVLRCLSKYSEPGLL